MSIALSLGCIYPSFTVLYFNLSDDDIQIKSKIYSLKHILHSQDVFSKSDQSSILYLIQPGQVLSRYVTALTRLTIFQTKYFWIWQLPSFRKVCPIQYNSQGKNLIFGWIRGIVYSRAKRRLDDVLIIAILVMRVIQNAEVYISKSKL